MNRHRRCASIRLTTANLTTRLIGCGILALSVTLASAVDQPASTPDRGAGPSVATRLSADGFHTPDGQLRGLISTLLEENPEIASYWARSSSSFQRVPQQKSLPDPQLTYRYFAQTPETRVGPQNHSLEVSQGLPWIGKRRLQAERAESIASGFTWEAEDVERRLVAQLKAVYFKAAYLQEALAVNAEERELLSRFEGIALSRYATGQGIQQNVVKIQTEISRLEDRDSELRERLDAALRRIAELIGHPAAPLALQPIDLPLPDVPYDRDELEQRAMSQHPRVRAIERRVDADQTWARRQQLESRPDFRLGMGYIEVSDREDTAGITNPPDGNGKDVLALTVGVNIPIYRKRIHAAIAEAREGERASGAMLEAVRNRLRFDIQDALLRVDSLGARGRLFRDVIIPQAQESLASAEAAYTTDRLGFLDLLDAERILFQSRLSLHRLVADLWTALADLELSVGEPFPSSRSGGTNRDQARTGSTS